MKTGRMAGAVLVTVAMILVLAACGREDVDPGATNGEPEGTPIDEGPATGRIVVWAMGAEGEGLGVMAEEFMAENPDASVEVTAIPWDAAHDRLATAVAGAQTPDVSQMGTTWMGEFGHALDPTPDTFDPGAFFDGAWDTTVVDGVSVGVPWYVETRLIYYRTDLAEDAGFTEPPGNWDELKEMARGMQEAGADWGIALQPGGTGSWQTYLPFAWQAGGGITDEDGNFILDSESNTRALEFYVSFFDEGLSPSSLEPGALEQGFIDGSIGMFISGPWHIDILREQGAEDGTWGLGLMPSEEGGRTSFVGGANLVVFRDAQNRDGAWKFVEYMSRPEVQARWYEEVNALPSAEAGWDDEALADDEHLTQFGQQLEDAQAPPSIPTWQQIADAIDAQVERAAIGGTSAEEAVSQMQQEAESVGMGQ
jgi:multiple sugar transport system substrate-binding protein